MEDGPKAFGAYFSCWNHQNPWKSNENPPGILIPATFSTCIAIKVISNLHLQLVFLFDINNNSGLMTVVCGPRMMADVSGDRTDRVGGPGSSNLLAPKAL